MANVKVTKRDYFMALRAVVEGGALATPVADTLAFIDNELDLLERKASKAKTTQTKTQKENEVILDTLRTVMATVDKPLTIAEIQALSAELAALSNQKMSALITKLLKAGEVERTEIKKKAYFAFVATNGVE